MRILTLLAATFSVGFLVAGEVCAQAGRLPIRFLKPPPIRPVVPPAAGRGWHVPVHLPTHGSQDIDQGWCILLFAFGILVLVLVGWYVLFRRRKGPAPSRRVMQAGATFSVPHSHSRQAPYQSPSAPEFWTFSVPPPPCPREDHHRAWPKQAPRTLPVPPPEDLILSAEEVEEKALSTLWLLDELAQRDPVLNPASLEAFITATFLQVQECWEKRDYGPVRDLLAPSLLAEHEELLQVMRRERVINRIESLSVRRLEFVHVFCPEATDRHEVTALITFEARTYFVHEETGADMGGSRKVLPYQEFWVFRRRGDAWRLHMIDRDPSDQRGLRARALV